MRSPLTRQLLPRATAVGATTAAAVAAAVALSGGPALAAAARPAAHGSAPAFAAYPTYTAQPLPAEPQAPASAAAPLSSAFSKAFAHVHGGVTGTAVVDGVGTVMSRNSSTWEAPASTTKLITTGTALLTLGADYRFVTTVVRTGSDGSTQAEGSDVSTPALADSQGTLHGDLVLVGAGDPTLTSRDLLGLARSVRSAGVRSVTGTLLLDDTKFDKLRGARGWKAGYVGGDSGVLSALMVDTNHRSHAKSYLSDPGPSNIALFLADLRKAGVTVAHGAHVGRSPQAVTATVASHRSQPLSMIVRSTDKFSINTYAEMLLKDVGATTGVGSTNAGLAVERRVAAGFGLSIGRLVDGSGLSTIDRLTSAQEVNWLRAMDTTPIAGALRAALPVSCHDGTLAGRLCGAWVSGRVHAKTGTLDHTAALAGYTTTRSGKTVYFSFIADRTSLGAARAAIDAAVAALARSTV